MSYTVMSIGEPPGGNVVATCVPSQAALAAGTVRVGMLTKSFTSTTWLVVVEMIRLMTDIGAVFVGPVTALAAEMYDAPASDPSSDGTPTNGSTPCTGRSGDFW